jgi:hypothetical protein
MLTTVIVAALNRGYCYKGASRNSMKDVIDGGDPDLEEA